MRFSFRISWVYSLVIASIAILSFPGHLIAAFDSAEFNAGGGPLEILRITPDGEDVPASRQIVLSFSRPVVPVGRMEREPSEIPIEISPKLDCEWRWLNTSALACQLTDENTMRPATKYHMTIKPGIKAEDGSTIENIVQHTFITERPKVTSAWFKTWASPSKPVIQVRFNQPIRKDSATKHLYIEIAGGERYALTISSDKEFEGKTNYESATTWLVTPTSELPLDTESYLNVENGIESEKGSELGIESRTVVKFNTFPAFSFNGMRCYNNNDKLITIKPGDINDNNRCNPLRHAELIFSAPVTKEAIKENIEVIPDLAGGRTDYDPWVNVYSYSRLGSGHRKGADYSVRLPEILKAYETYHFKSSPGAIKDEFGRPLAEGIDLKLFTDHRNPDYTLGSNFSVLEKGLDTEMPLIITNIDKVNASYSAMNPEGIESSSYEFTPGKAEDIAFKVPLGIRKMLSGKSGIVQGSFKTEPNIRNKWNLANWFFSQVTPYSVHVKLGHFNSTAWVTDLTTGSPVTGVKVDIFRGNFDRFDDSPEVLSSAMTGEDGIAALEGIKVLDPSLHTMGNRYYWYRSQNLFIRCTKGEDIALIPLIQPFEVEAQGSNNDHIATELNRDYGHMKAWGTTAQGIYKAGDTIQFKLYARNQDNRRFIEPPKDGYSLEVIDPMGKTAYEVANFSLSEFGAYEDKFAIPETGAVGWYRFVMKANFNGEFIWEPMKVLVSDFTPSPFRVTTELDGELYKAGDKIKVITSARLHSGGPYGDAGARITGTVNSSYFYPKTSKAKGFYFNTYSHRSSDTVFQMEEKLGSNGNLEKALTMKNNSVLYGRLTVESAVRDDRGKYVASSVSAAYVGRDRFVGINQPEWVLKVGKPTVIRSIVVDERGEPALGTDISIGIEYLKTTASRVKGAGNAYLTHYNHDWVKVHNCNIKSSGEAVSCEFTPEEPGSYRMTTRIKDTKGRSHESAVGRWAVGKGQVVWEAPEGNTLNIYPEKDKLNIGDKARYLVQNPFPGAKAMISLERYGILKSWVETFENSTEIIEFDIEPDYLPGFYLSVTVMSPRVDKPLGEGEIDLGKPSFKSGYVKVPVKDPYKEITVEVKSDREEHRPRDMVAVDFRASLKGMEGVDKKPPIELAVAVLDEAVFDLIQGGKGYFDPYEGFYGLEPLDLKNFSLLLQLVGRQKFEMKGANAGGDGGPDISLRSVDKFVAYWNPSIKTDQHGKATINFQVPDNLTGWRVLAMAVTPGDRMGLGEGIFRVNKPTELRSVLPNQVTEGDEFRAGFSIMNRSTDTRKIRVKIKAEGAINIASEETEQVVTAVPYKRTIVWLPVKTKGDGEIVFTAKAWDDKDGDGLKHSLPVNKRKSLETAATYGTTTNNVVSENIHFPEKIREDLGGLSVVLSPSVIGNVEGAFKYLRDYPYICWEQKLTKGVMAAHYINLRGYLPDDLLWTESQALPENTLALSASYQAPNGGMVYYIPENRYVSPYLSAYTALAMNWLRKSRYAIPGGVENRLHDYLLELLRKDTMPDFYSNGMASTVRAVALAALAPHGKIGLEDMNRYRMHLPEMSLFGKAHYLKALMSISGTEEIRKDVAKMILAHANETGGKFIFSETLDGSYERILATPLRDNCAVLSSLLDYGETTEGSAYVASIPFKLVRTITQSRGNRDYWENTQENMFCMNALTDFSRIYESEKPNMTVLANYEKQQMGITKIGDIRAKTVEFERPMKKGDAGKKGTLKINRFGTGRLYYAARLSYSPLTLKGEPINSGIEIKREYSLERDGKWEILDANMEIRSGDLVRVDIYVSLPTARNFVVVNDPVPGGLEPVNRDLATASNVDADKGEFRHAGSSFWHTRDDWYSYGYSRWSFYHKELRHDSVRFYSEYLPAGNYHLSYVAQAIAPGEFVVMPTHAEEMYDPDVFGKWVPANLKVIREQ